MDGVAGSGLRSHDKYGRLIMHDETGKEFVQLPKTRRPNGTWREGKKVKPDYMPQDEMAAYMSKGTQVRFFHMKLRPHCCFKGKTMNLLHNHNLLVLCLD